MLYDGYDSTNHRTDDGLWQGEKTPTTYSYDIVVAWVLGLSQWPAIYPAVEKSIAGCKI